MTEDKLLGDTDPASLAPVIGDPSRMRVLMALADGRALPASVLAAEAGVSTPTASSHLARLQAAGLLTQERSGRHRYYRLADERVAAVVEALAQLAPRRPITSLRASTQAHALREARTCYDHLAGRLGVAVTQALVERGALRALDGGTTTERREGEPISAQLGSSVYELGPAADAVLHELGLELDEILARKRQLLRFCLDWSEQRHHLSGALGAAICETALEREWVTRRREGRALLITDRGREELGALLPGTMATG